MTSAVHLDGATEVHTIANMVGVVNGPKFLSSMWVNNVGAVGPMAAGYPNANWQLNNTGLELRPTASAWEIDGSTRLLDASGLTTQAGSTWINLLWSVDTTNPDPGKQIQFLRTGVDNLDVVDNGLPGGDIDIAGQFFLGGDGYGSFCTFDVADVQVWFGISPDLTNPTNVAAFVAAGKPVNPTMATGLFGAPHIRLVGNATTFGTNVGSAGAMATTGTLTNASTSPSD